ncbi:MAG: FumA C-terminus/TtdB family hydratase beta subunit [Clostridia bacterium]|nr:FumA C-terminus/TtdB family hydratase beta subunit [Clostridia bacterium]
MEQIRIEVSEIKKRLPELRAGQSVLLSGTVYTARDAAHKRLCDLISAGGELPIDLQGATIYYAGPTPAPDGLPIGSCGPTPSSRMDTFSPTLLDCGVVAMIGKGNRSESVRASIMKNGAVYFCAVGGAGAIAAKSVVSAEIIAFPELGCEAIRKLQVRDFPLIVGIDHEGRSLFDRD